VAALKFILHENAEFLDVAFYFFTLPQRFIEILYCLGTKLCTG
jgi:hypothetical protein